jgi:hypothetical protein
MKKKRSLLSLYLKTIKRQYIYSPIEDSEVVLIFERNNAGLKKLSSFSGQTSDSSAFLSAMCFLRYVLNCEQHSSYFDADYPTAGLTVTVLASVSVHTAGYTTVTNHHITDCCISETYFP